MSWITENLGSLIVTVFILLVLANALRIMIRNKKNGQCSCGCSTGCTGSCSTCGQCPGAKKEI